jgi:class 3 adenylate cyclase
MTRRVSEPPSDLEVFVGKLLDQPGNADSIEAEIRERFEKTLAVMVIDLCGFSRTARLHGIVACLLMIARMKRIARPIVSRHRATIVEAIGDNLLCVLDTADAALAASVELIQAVRAANRGLANGQSLHVSIGIGFGPILNDSNRRVAGYEVNIASKLGEDLAAADEILLTDEARQALDAQCIELDRIPVTVAGIDLVCYRTSA